MLDWIYLTPSFFKYEDQKGLQIGGFTLRDQDSEEQIDRLISNEKAWLFLGNSKKRNLINQPYFLFSPYSQRKDIILGEGDSLANLVNQETAFISDLITYLWFAKDNCCSITSIVGHSDRYENTINFMPASGPTMANSSHQVVNFIKDDFDLAFNIALKVHQISNTYQATSSNKDQQVQHGLFMLNNKTDYNKLNRIDRAIRFLATARNEQILPIKITYYVFVLECLFSANDGIEIQHKLGERIAIYMENDLNERTKIYEDFKESYGIRSKYIHGQEISGPIGKKEDKLIQVSINLDSLVRKTMLKAIMQDSESFLLPPDEQKKWFNNMLFK